MWLREFSEIFDVLPYYLLVCLPIFIALSPINPVESASELDVHRLAQFELGGNLHGSKQAALTMDARGPGVSQVVRKTVVVKMAELSVAGFRDLVSSGVGGLLLLIPPGLAGLSAEAREAVLQLEEELVGGDLEIPVYFAEENPELNELYETLRSEGEGGEDASSALAAMMSSISNSGYQLIISAPTPQPVKDQAVVSTSGLLGGSSGEDQLPTILVVAHYDAGAGAPSLATGADSNGSGVSILLELARLFSALYSGSRTHPAYSLVFLLSGGGKLNYAGTKRWLEEHLDHDTTSDLLSNVKFILCLDSLGKNKPLNLHVSKPPKEGSAGAIFLENLRSVSSALFPNLPKPEMVHKKINLADDTLSWEHERFSIRRLPAFTLSHFTSPRNPERQTLLDSTSEVSGAVLQRNTRLVAEALACSLYPRMEKTTCSGELFSGSLEPKEESLMGWLRLATSFPRHPSLLSDKNSDLVKSLTSALARYTQDVSTVVGTPDRREPEYVLYDTATATMNVYR
ncbi:nicalin-1-like [Eurytemora carolleeae]|uniref:nicalin-1-like n=1 Tax=Eurytemora carolleeae TaxID=1294199 RepID=UPI000C78DB35|nr:nicalin-1-like [Eurytemora carolleeae]|eukprot:XP_023344303.1 nicalin-1-like [Eurytemora affinis]